MKLTMLAEISGLRDGKPWPKRHGQITVPDDEAESLIESGLAKKYEKAGEDAEAEVVDEVAGPEVEVTTMPEPETATTPAPKKRAPAKKAATKKAAPKSGKS